MVRQTDDRLREFAQVESRNLGSILFVHHTGGQLQGKDEVLGDDLRRLCALAARPRHPRLEEEVGRHRGGQLLGIDHGLLFRRTLFEARFHDDDVVAIIGPRTLTIDASLPGRRFLVNSSTVAVNIQGDNSGLLQTLDSGPV